MSETVYADGSIPSVVGSGFIFLELKGCEIYKTSSAATLNGCSYFLLLEILSLFLD